MRAPDFAKTSIGIMLCVGLSSAFGAEFDRRVLSSPPELMATSTEPNAILTFAPTGQNMSNNGRFVVFSSGASNLPGGNPESRISQSYLFDETSELITLLSPTGDNEPSSGDTFNTVISGDGNVIAFTAYSPNEGQGQDEGEVAGELSQLIITDRANRNVETLSQLLGRAPGSVSSFGATLSNDGRYIAFISANDDLVANDTNGVSDLFVLDREQSALSRINIASDGTQSDEPPTSAVISDNGNIVSFVSAANTLVAGDTDQQPDLFVHTRSTGETQRVVANTVGGSSVEVSLKDAVMSRDGRYFAFQSSSDALAVGIRSSIDRVYRHDWSTGETELASLIEPVSSNINEQLTSASSPAISADGQIVGFVTPTGAEFRDFGSNTISPFAGDMSQLISYQRFLKKLDMSADGTAFLLTTQLRTSIAESFSTRRSQHFRIDQNKLTTFAGAPLLSATADDESVANGDGSVSADGRFAVFSTRAPSYTQTDSFEQHIVLADTLNNTRFVLTRGQSLGDERVISQAAVISDSGSHVVFESNANQFARMVETADDDGGANDLFVYELATGEITHASKPNPSLPFPSRAYRNPDISENGRYLAFNSSRSNVLQDDGTERVYRLDRITDEIVLISKTPEGSPNDGRASRPKMSSDGNSIVFSTVSPRLRNLIGNDPTIPLFLWDRASGSTRQITLPAPTQFFGANFALSGNGRFLAYTIRASLDPADQRDQLWLYDLLTQQGEIIDEGEILVIGTVAEIMDPVVSHSGRYISYISTRGGTSTSVLAPDPASLFRADRLANDRVELTGTLDTNSFRNPPFNPAISADGSAIVFTSAHPEIATDLNVAADVFISQEVDPGGALFSAVLPSSRSAVIGGSSTAYASLIGNETMSGCRLKLANNLDLDFAWQAIDLATGTALSNENTPIDLIANQPTSLLLRLSANSAIATQELVFDAWCDTGQATSAIVGLNTLQFSATASPRADIVALTASEPNDGTVTVPSGGEYGFFSMATFNVGASDEIRIQPTTTGTASVDALICETVAATGACLSPPSESIQIAMGADESASFAVFVRANQAVSFDPANNRISVQFFGSDGVNRGRTSLALR